MIAIRVNDDNSFSPMQRQIFFGDRCVREVRGENRGYGFFDKQVCMYVCCCCLPCVVGGSLVLTVTYRFLDRYYVGPGLQTKIITTTTKAKVFHHHNHPVNQTVLFSLSCMLLLLKYFTLVRPGTMSMWKNDDNAVFIHDCDN